MPTYTLDLLARWNNRIVVNPETGCWDWMGQINNWGYGVAAISQRKTAVHRVVYELLVGPIPDGMQIDHTCRNRRCQNPDHLQVVTLSENVALGKLRNTHCPQGHEYTAENLLPNETYRKCRTCNRERCKARYHAKKASA